VFKDFALITPNEREARFALGDQDSGLRPLASALYDTARCKTLILKLGERGVLTCRSAEHESLDSYIVMDSFAERVVDAVGAGDALLAYATLGKLATGSDAVATILGSIAAACECELDGNVPVTPANVVGRIDEIERSASYNESGRM
jgi:sugar/nucleoside kinase (ribokinase family)